MSTFNPPIPDVTYNGVTMQEIIEALDFILDGESEFSLRDMTGIPLEECEKIMELYYKVIKTRRPY